MKTTFAPEQLNDPATATSEKAIRNCVHCGFCTATCPTYVLLGDERDSPRGRIYLIKDMLEKNATPTAEVVSHIDRCLSCLSCTTTCPSGVDYMHLIDHARPFCRTGRDLERRLRWEGLFPRCKVYLKSSAPSGSLRCCVWQGQARRRQLNWRVQKR